MKTHWFLLGVAAYFSGISTAVAEASLMQSQVKGLLVIKLPDGSFAGTASQMNATSVPAENKETFGVRFNQPVGKMMTAATAEVEKLMRVRHPEKLPIGQVIEFGFADKHSPKDGPSAAVACAMLAESIITGDKLDPGFAVTGDITATGEVRPIGGVGAKVRGASRKDCKVIAVPKANQASIDDIYVSDGIGPIVETQIILIESLDQALLVGKDRKTADIQAAMDEYALVQTALARSPGNASHPKVIEKLKIILKAMPNHESARLIALHGGNRGPDKLSLVGSLNAIQEGANQLGETLKDGSFTDRGMSDPLWDNVTRLTNLRDGVDPRTRDYLDAFLSTARFFKENRERKYMSLTMKKELQSAINKIKTEEKKLINSREIQEELMNE